ncbi:MAG: HD-GYP domain-containing protein, partial [Candidatus Hinthialibacter sp.]
VQSLSNALEARDPYTQGHAQNVSDIVVLLAHEVGMDEKNDIVLRLAAQLHDIGKIGIPDSILLKPGKLNQEEWEVMRKHPEIGYRILSPIPSLQEVSRYVYEHHERWDGGGYPQGLRGEEIHPISRLLITAERYDALSSERVYKKAWPREKIVAYYRENAGKAFDPDTAEALVRLIERNKLKTWDRASATLEKAYP